MMNSSRKSDSSVNVFRNAELIWPLQKFGVLYTSGCLFDQRSGGCGSPSIIFDAGVQIGILFTRLHLAVNKQHLSLCWTEVWLVSVGKVMWTALETTKLFSRQKQMTLMFFSEYLFFFFWRFANNNLLLASFFELQFKRVWLAGGEQQVLRLV